MLRPFSPLQEGVSDPFSHRNRGKSRTSQNPLSENPLSENPLSATHQKGRSFLLTVRSLSYLRLILVAYGNWLGLCTYG